MRRASAAVHRQAAAKLAAAPVSARGPYRIGEDGRLYLTAISAQTYKANCPPAVLTKLPLIADRPVMDFVVSAMHSALGTLGPRAER